MKNLLIVESPAKAKTIEKYLGAGYRVISSVGHVRDLVPEDGSVDTENNFAMKWAIMSGKEKAIKQILDEVKKADTVYLATDEDREGEAIAWHIFSILDDKKALVGKKIYRITFNEITKKAVESAIESPREIDGNLVDAYLVRRALDYLIGFKLSPVLWRKNMGKSAGRVQSVAVALVIDREREVMAFNPVEYWSLSARCAEKGLGISDKGLVFLSKLTKWNGEKIDKMTIENKTSMDEILSTLIPNPQSLIPASVVSVEKKKSSRKPAAPFTTSTLQQEAARKLGFSAKRTGMAAQKLYEAGHITYIRTDSVSLAADAVEQLRNFIGEKYGNPFLPGAAIKYATKSKNAQEAHEAIRPVDVNAVNAGDADDEKKLYDLIWKRTVACQMTNAEFDSVVVDIKPDNADAIFHSVGTTRTFDGFMKVYVEDEDDKNEDGDAENKLPPLSVGDTIDITELLPKQHFTAPPPRYTEASLIKKMEELGIGRPSTYAAIMSTIIDRQYVKIETKRFFPTPTGWLLSAYLAKYFGNIVDVNFTANMEDTMDDVAGGDKKKLDALEKFWGEFAPTIKSAKDIPTTEVLDSVNESLAGTLMPADAKCPNCGNKMIIKSGRFGPFMSCSDYPKCKTIQNFGTTQSEDGTAPANNNKDLGEGITYKVGRFGPYVTDGEKNASAKKYSFDDITLDIARELLSGEKKKIEAIELGTNPATGKPILYYADGRYGAYISSNKVNVSVKEQPDLEVAADLINNKKPSTKRGWGKK
ncbi:MAG: type I DNA topoisomerase [Alphaproteobacteria bacterium]|nr:type I DNA topoisomerase [Alphaproteobacteria bacterium]